jgi:acetyl esterase/lipase
MKHHSWFPCLIVLTQSLFAQQPADKTPQRSVLSYIDADGTAYITRLVNVPETISAEAQKSLVAQHSPPPHPPNPVLSPVFADLHGMPPTLFMTSTRDMLLSHTAILYRAFLRAGVAASLGVFEGLNRCFWYDPILPESRKANQIMADFLDKHLGSNHYFANCLEQGVTSWSDE